ncbi:MAG: tRNA lysidine(34) synthetase TilS [Ferruginibacter sp.]
MNLLQSFQQYIKDQSLFQSKDRLLLAVSGGVDSVVLTELCKQSGYDFEIAHCNFQLRGKESDRDENFVKNLAKKYNAPFHLKNFDTITEAKNKKLSIETTARDLRYEWFNELTSDNSTLNTQPPTHILTAHHANDSIETLLMNFFRGTGIKGLHGILPKQGRIIRPLLFAKKTQLELFARENNLVYVSDHTNSENEYTRNYFRNELIPAIQKIFPQAEDNLLNNLQRFNEIEILYEQSIALHKKKLLEAKGHDLHIPVMKLLKATPLHAIMYSIIRDFNFTAHQTEEAIALLKSDSGKYIVSSTHRILKNRGWLIISALQQTEQQLILIEKDDQEISFSGGNLQIRQLKTADWKLQTENTIASLNMDSIQFPLILRKWKQGDYFYPLGMKKKKKLSRFFIDQKLSLTEKENTWLLENDKKIIWIIGMRIDDRFKVTASTKNILKISLKKKDA